MSAGSAWPCFTIHVHLCAPNLMHALSFRCFASFLRLPGTKWRRARSCPLSETDYPQTTMWRRKTSLYIPFHKLLFRTCSALTSEWPPPRRAGFKKKMCTRFCTFVECKMALSSLRCLISSCWHLCLMEDWSFFFLGGGMTMTRVNVSVFLCFHHSLSLHVTSDLSMFFPFLIIHLIIPISPPPSFFLTFDYLCSGVAAFRWFSLFWAELHPSLLELPSYRQTDAAPIIEPKFTPFLVHILCSVCDFCLWTLETLALASLPLVEDTGIGLLVQEPC